MTAATEIPSEVVVHDQPSAMVRATPSDVVSAFKDYQQIQQALDSAMPDCLMTIQGRKFRKKSYWRAIATAFNLSVVLKEEQRVGDDWIVTYTASAKNGRSADGDGSCSMDEKRGNMATIHNVRAHAHTRAYNRAVSNLVGFGEVSAEEMNDNGPQATPKPRAVGGITDKQRKRLYAISHSTAERLQIPQETIDGYARKFMADLGFESSRDLTRDAYDKLCDKLENLSLTDLAKSEAPEPEQEEVF